jgi:hypothetical protein
MQYAQDNAHTRAHEVRDADRILIQGTSQGTSLGGWVNLRGDE